MARYRVDVSIEGAKSTRRDRVTAMNPKHVQRIKEHAKSLAKTGDTVTFKVTEKR